MGQGWSNSEKKVIQEKIEQIESFRTHHAQQLELVSAYVYEKVSELDKEEHEQAIRKICWESSKMFFMGSYYRNGELEVGGGSSMKVDKEAE